jgi:hypothetical protein
MINLNDNELMICHSNEHIALLVHEPDKGRGDPWCLSVLLDRSRRGGNRYGGRSGRTPGAMANTPNSSCRINTLAGSLSYPRALGGAP